MKAHILASLSALSLAACTIAPAPRMEAGYAPGDLGLAAIERADWQTAEERILHAEARGHDPARLINLGKVYMETGRRGAALSAWRLALASGGHHMVETAGGRVVSTRDLAREALAMHDTERRSADAGR